ncbi:MAG: M48 family metallopeptidase [Bacteroidales bacterium]|nr:M48 family metallopeptidase [Bacteroidales bacterium]
MKRVINKSGDYELEELGVVRINVKRGMRNFTARWKGGQLVIGAPWGCDYDSLLDAAHRMNPRLQKIKPQPLYHIGQEIRLPEFTVRIIEQHYVPERMLMNFRGSEGIIQVGSQWDMAAPATMTQISKFLCRMAQSRADGILLPRAREISHELGVSPLMWMISNGHRTLGTTTSKGIISLSYALVFYPQRLRDFVVKHELAHLSEMNHSPRFHEICDAYCGGQEQELLAEFRAYKIPIVK